jgi:Leucine-rich repeat (LRR) protein
LKKLKADKNEIKYVSSKIIECISLEQLILDENNIEMLPSEIS